MDLYVSGCPLCENLGLCASRLLYATIALSCAMLCASTHQQFHATHLDVRPLVAEVHLSSVLVNVGERIVDVREVLLWDLLRGKLAVIDTPGVSFCRLAATLTSSPADVSVSALWEEQRATHEISNVPFALHFGCDGGVEVRADVYGVMDRSGREEPAACEEEGNDRCDE